MRLLALAAVLGFQAAALLVNASQRLRGEERRRLDEQCDSSYLADSRRGDPNVIKYTESDPPAYRARSRAYYKYVTDNEFISDHVILHNLYNGVTGQLGTIACQWHNEMSWNNTRQGLLDRRAMYMIQFIPELGEDGAIKVTGEFFPVMYFSYQAYADPSQAEAGANIIDEEIIPYEGLNPFKNVNATPETSGKYEIYWTTSGKHGLPNEQKLNITRGIGVLVLRLYKPIPLEPLPLTEAIVPPKIQFGRLSDPKSWNIVFPPCTPQLRGTLSYGATWLYQRWESASRVGLPLTGHCPMPLGTTGMRLFDSTKTSSLTRSVIVARNENSPYLFYCLDTRSLRRRQLTANDVVLRLTAKMPPFARGLYNGSNPRIAEKSKYDVRYATFLTTGPMIPFQTYEGIDGQAIQEIYNKHLGLPANDTQGWDGKFTLIIATDENRPKKCGFLKDDSEIFLGYRQLKDEGANEPDLVNPPFNPSLVYRQEVADKNKPTAAKAAKECAGGDACADDGFLKGVMEDYYPAVEAFYCFPDGRLERIPKADEAEVVDRFPQTIPGVTNPSWSRPRPQAGEFGLAPYNRVRRY